MTAPDVAVTVVVVTWQGRHLLEECLASLQGQDLAHHVLVVDNASTDGTRELLEALPHVEVVLMPTNVGFAGGVAAALPRITTRFVALLNNDATADPGWLRAAVGQLEADPTTAGTSSRMVLGSGAPADLSPTEPAHRVVNNTGIVLLADGYGADRGLGRADGPDFDESVEVFGPSGGAAVLRTLAVKAVGGLDARYFMYYEDTDLAWRLRLAGWRHLYCPTAVVHHRHAASSQPGSPSFALHTERNRLLTLARCAPWPVVLRQVSRFVVTTGSITASRLLRRPLPPSAVFSPVVRVRALVSFARLAPDLVRVRRESTRRRRTEVWRTWSGVAARSLDTGVARS